jgi:signal transduction histidine kinase/ActR/RegA family two-component response regulator
LLKPFSERELHAALQMVMERRRADSLSQADTLRLKSLVQKRDDELATAHQSLAHEMAERAHAEQAFAQAQKMESMGKITGGVAHDFNNLLQVVGGNLSLLARNPLEESPRSRRLLNGAIDGTRRAAALTHRLLAFSRRQPLQPRPIAANALIKELLELLQRALGESNELKFEPAEQLVSVTVDPSQLESALLNLAINARDAMPHGGVLTIKTGNVTVDRPIANHSGHLAPGDYVLITISDTGCGMDANTAAHAFEPFFTTKDVGEGSGLGLSQVYGFLKQSGGHVMLSSEVGKGTTVKIYLPQGSAPATEAVTRIVPKPETLPGNETILVVEDDPDVRAFTVDMLSELGYTVLEAPDAARALEQLSLHHTTIDLMYTDVVLPGGVNGAVLARTVATKYPNIKILFTTGYSRDAIIHAGQVDKGVDLITKPFTYDQLEAKLRQVLDKRA